MKINYSLIVVSLILTVIGACKDDPSDVDDPGPEVSDTSRQSETSSDTASLENLIDQYEPPGRVVWQKPEKVIDKMGDLGNKVIADLGAGSGFFSRRLAQQAKKVIALEINERLLHFMDSIKLIELKPEYQDRLETRRATPTNSMLQPGEADIILIVNTYIYIDDRVEYLKHLLDVLPVGGEIIIVDFKKKRMPIKYPPVNVRLELYEVENELYEAGFRNIVSDDCALDYQYIIMAEK